ncbi:prolyl oligopeptidase family serine peptidase [Kibdelosporangium aridum]|uniref:prolyl oligopeptidase n=1 Tax=Kibdelosporangium aridum TaxID=2030 RepID=A0A1Y5X323_KIBAR|nr:prolyl oligopeptidase family serine peptidase [Kibdelosporangium aridum]SMC67425.1 prolyl oligopeptidase [Kibdelosporangium aridum]
MAPRRPVSKTIGGVTFEDPYDWLRAETDEVRQWQERQVAAAVQAIRESPNFDAVLESLRATPSSVEGVLSVRIAVAGRWFWLGRNGSAQALMVAEERDGAGRVLLNAAEMTARRGDDRPTTFIYVIPSPDGKLVAFSHAAGGEPFGQYGVVDVDTGRLLDVAVPTMQGNMLRVDWLPDSTGFFVHGRTQEGKHALRFVPVTPDAVDRPEAVFEFSDVSPTALGLTPQVSPEGRYVLGVTVPHEYVASVIGDLTTGQWRRFTPADFTEELHGAWLDDDTYLAIVTDTPRGRVVAIPAATSVDRETWREIIPAGERVLRSLDIVDGRIVLSALKDVSLDVSVHELDGTFVGTAPLPRASASFGLVLDRVRPRSDEFIFAANTFTSADTRYRLDVGKVGLTVLEDGRQLEDIEVTQYFATSADGTQVPYFVMAKSDVETPRPTLVNAYGGFNIPWLPVFLGDTLPFIEAGGIYVRANLRGGSEYGRDWYESGRRQHKQNVFDDLRAVAEDLTKRGIASSLAFHGASNGGLLAGVAAVQQPELWRAIVAQVPVLDVLEPLSGVEGADAILAVYAKDYGDPNEDAKVLASYSPYHNVQPGVSYPAVLQVIGEHDIGCPPFQGRKFTAALRHATASDNPVLLRIWQDVGHGSLDPAIGAEMRAEILTFLMDQLGLTACPTSPPAS